MWIKLGLLWRSKHVELRLFTWKHSSFKSEKQNWIECVLCFVFWSTSCTRESAPRSRAALCGRVRSRAAARVPTATATATRSNSCLSRATRSTGSSRLLTAPADRLLLSAHRANRANRADTLNTADTLVTQGARAFRWVTWPATLPSGDGSSLLPLSPPQPLRTEYFLLSTHSLHFFALNWIYSSQFYMLDSMHLMKLIHQPLFFSLVRSDPNNFRFFIFFSLWSNLY